MHITTKKKEFIREFYLQNQDAIKSHPILGYPGLYRLHIEHSHIILPDCISHLQFKRRNHYNIQEQFSSIQLGFFRSQCREILLDNRLQCMNF